MAVRYPPAECPLTKTFLGEPPYLAMFRNIGGGFRFGTEPIVNRHHRDPFSFEFQRNRTISIFQCATVKPHNGGKLF